MFHILRLLQWRIAAADLCSIGVMAPKFIIITEIDRDSWKGKGTHNLYIVKSI